MIRFKYKMNDGLYEFVTQNIANYSDIYLHGILSESLVKSLAHCSLYLVAEVKNIDNNDIMLNPMVVVAQSNTMAIDYYNEFTGIRNATCIVDIENRCDKIKVEAE